MTTARLGDEPPGLGHSGSATRSDRPAGPDWRIRAVLAALLLSVVFVGLRSLAPGLGPSVTVPSRAISIGIGAALELVLAALVIGLRWRSSVSYTTPRLRRTLHDILQATLTGLLILIGAATILASLKLPRRRKTFRLQPPARPSPSPRKSHKAINHHGAIDLTVIRYLLLAALAAAIVAVAVYAWRRRPVRSPRIEPEVVLTDPAVELAKAVEAGWAALRRAGDVRAAIIACYLAMEASLAEAGAARSIAETPDELLHRSVAEGFIDAGAGAWLTHLFYEARFSSHGLPPKYRDHAERALAMISDDLRDRAVLRGSGAGATP